MHTFLQAAELIAPVQQTIYGHVSIYCIFCCSFVFVEFVDGGKICQNHRNKIFMQSQ
jgi:hypothetical protein